MKFAGDNRGLVIAEVELASSRSRCRPRVGVEVTRQGKYYNGSLAQRPFTTWSTRLAQAAQ
jgi:CYTH domain-containing protein